MQACVIEEFVLDPCCAAGKLHFSLATLFVGKGVVATHQEWMRLFMHRQLDFRITLGWSHLTGAR